MLLLNRDVPTLCSCSGRISFGAGRMLNRMDLHEKEPGPRCRGPGQTRQYNIFHGSLWGSREKRHRNQKYTSRRGAQVRDTCMRYEFYSDNLEIQAEFFYYYNLGIYSYLVCICAQQGHLSISHKIALKKPCLPLTTRYACSLSHNTSYEGVPSGSVCIV